MVQFVVKIRLSIYYLAILVWEVFKFPKKWNMKWSWWNRRWKWRCSKDSCFIIFSYFFFSSFSTFSNFPKHSRYKCMVALKWVLFYFHKCLINILYFRLIRKPAHWTIEPSNLQIHIFLWIFLFKMSNFLLFLFIQLRINFILTWLKFVDVMGNTNNNIFVCDFLFAYFHGIYNI